MEIFELSTLALVLISVAVLLASIISSVTGMAGGILMFTAMSVAIPIKPLIAIHGTVQVFGNASRSWLLRQHIRWTMCVPFSIGAVIGATATTLFIAQYIDRVLPLIILLLLIAYTLFKPKTMPAIKVSDGGFFWVGIATGGLGIIAGAIDPLLAAFFIRDDLSKEEVVSNKSMMQFVVHLTKIPAFIFLGFSFSENIGVIITFIISAIIGVKIGVLILGKINTEIFFKLMRFALLLAGMRIAFQLVETLWS